MTASKNFISVRNKLTIHKASTVKEGRNLASEAEIHPNKLDIRQGQFLRKRYK
jgi:hypothetical protein